MTCRVNCKNQNLSYRVNFIKGNEFWFKIASILVIWNCAIQVGVKRVKMIEEWGKIKVHIAKEMIPCCLVVIVKEELNFAVLTNKVNKFELPNCNKWFKEKSQGQCILTLLFNLCFLGFFMTKIFHPNVANNGEICVNTLKKDWKPDLGVKHILLVGTQNYSFYQFHSLTIGLLFKVP